MSTQRWHWIWAVHLLANFFFKIALDKYYFPNNGQILLVSDECQNCAKNFTFWYHTSGDLLSKIWYQKFWHTFGTHLICRRILPLMIFQISAKIDDFFIFFQRNNIVKFGQKLMIFHFGKNGDVQLFAKNDDFLYNFSQIFWNHPFIYIDKIYHYKYQCCLSVATLSWHQCQCHDTVAILDPLLVAYQSGMQQRPSSCFGELMIGFYHQYHSWNISEFTKDILKFWKCQKECLKMKLSNSQSYIWWHRWAKCQ